MLSPLELRLHFGLYFYILLRSTHVLIPYCIDNFNKWIFFGSYSIKKPLEENFGSFLGERLSSLKPGLSKSSEPTWLFSLPKIYPNTLTYSFPWVSHSAFFFFFCLSSSINLRHLTKYWYFSEHCFRLDSPNVGSKTQILKQVYIWRWSQGTPTGKWGSENKMGRKPRECINERVIYCSRHLGLRSPGDLWE